MDYTFQRVYLHCTSMSPFPFNRPQWKTAIGNQMSHPCFCKRSTIGHLNIQTATAEKLYTLINMLNIKF